MTPPSSACSAAPRSPPLTAIVFDMDGLMLDTEPLYKTAWQAASAELGYPLDDPSYVRLVGRPTEDCEPELVRQFGPEFLAFLDGQRLPSAVATSSEREYAAFSLRHAGLDGRFDVVVTGDEVARGKPAPDIYLEAARRLQVEPAACIALEDSEAGSLAASRAGMRSLLIPDWTRPSAAAVQAAFRVLASLREAHDLVAGLVTRAVR